MLNELIEMTEIEQEFESKDDIELLLAYDYGDYEVTKASSSWDEYNGFKIYLRQISHYSPLNREQEQHLFKIFTRGTLREKIEARDRVILSNQWLIISIARKFRGRGLDFDDLVQEGNLGLIVAIEKFVTFELEYCCSPTF